MIARRIISLTPSVEWNTPRALDGVSDFYKLKYLNNKFMVPTNAYGLATSSDGVDWTVTKNTFTSPGAFSIAYGNGKYIAVGLNGFYWSSNDGITWSSAAKIDPNVQNYFRDIIYDGSKFVTACDYFRVATSTDGTNWTCTNLHGTVGNLIHTIPSVIAYGPDKTYKYVITCWEDNSPTGKVLYSSDCVDWYYTTLDNNITLSSVIYAGGKYVAVGSKYYDTGNYFKGVIAYSTSGAIWSYNVINNTGGLGGIAYNGKNFIAVGSDGQIATFNKDAQTLESLTYVGKKDWTKILYNVNKFVVVGEDGYVTSSK